MSNAPNPHELHTRLATACAALAPDDPARAAFEAALQLFDAPTRGPIVAGPVTGARDVNIATNQTIQNTTIIVPPATAPLDPYAARLAWLARLTAHYGDVPEASAPPQSEPVGMPQLLDDLRLRLARGVLLWPADPSPATIDDLEARGRVALLLWPLIAAPLTGDPRYVLPIRWFGAAEAITSQPVAALIVELQKLYRQSTPEALFQRMLTELAQPQYAEGIQRLLADLSDPARGGRALEAYRLGQALPDQLLPPAAAAQATPLRLLAAGLGGALVGSGALAAADLVAGNSDALLQLVQRLVQQLRPASAQAAERPAASPARPTDASPNIVRTPSGDLSIPITTAQWRAELARRDAVFGQHGLRQSPVPYWCYIRAGTYKIGGWELEPDQIGGWEPEQPSARISLPKFWIARVPVTVAQYAPFAALGYGAVARRWWTPHGWESKVMMKLEQPSNWGKLEFSRANQPVIGASWYEAAAFCIWLNEQIGGTLPDGYALRLPTEAEWESAAAFDAAMQRRTHPWGEATPTPDRAVYEQHHLERLPDVGTRLSGEAACGALDMVGTVRECAASSYRGYPIQGQTFLKDFTGGEYDVPWRGGDYADISTHVRCGTRDAHLPGDHHHGGGFRIVVAARAL